MRARRISRRARQRSASKCPASASDAPAFSGLVGETIDGLPAASGSFRIRRSVAVERDDAGGLRGAALSGPSVRAARPRAALRASQRIGGGASGVSWNDLLPRARRAVAAHECRAHRGRRRLQPHRAPAAADRSDVERSGSAAGSGFAGTARSRPCTRRPPPSAARSSRATVRARGDGELLDDRSRSQAAASGLS